MNHIIKEPHPTLHQRTEEVPREEIVSPRVQRVLRDMSSALRATPDGIGLAAPQINVPLRIFIASEEALVWKEERDRTSLNTPQEQEQKKREWNHFVFINPRITKTSKKKSREVEGCLSVPNTYGLVERPLKVTVEAYDENGKKFTRGTTGLYAKVMQHEMDHLDGMLFISKAKNIKKIIKRKN